MKLTIAKVDEVLFQGQAKEVTCPGVDGVITILPHHSAFVTVLRAGEIKIVDDKEQEVRIQIEDGVLEVGGNEVTVIL